MAVALDTFAGIIRTSTNTIPVSLTVASGHSNLALVYLIASENNLTVSSVSGGGGGSWAKIGSVASAPFNFEIWALAGPSTGSVTATATMSGSITPDNNGVLYSLYNVDQTTVADGYASGTGHSLSTTLSSGGMVIAQLDAGGDPGAIVTGTEDYNNVNNAFWRTGHNSASGTVAWTASGNLMQICNVRQAVSVIPSTGAYQQEQSSTDRYQLEDGSGVYLIEPWGQVAVFLPPFIQGDLTGIGTPGRFFKDRLN